MFKISEFSKIALVPVTFLRYYEKIGLFCPKQIDRTNNYRYYSIEQLAELSRILALKELGLSLEQIKRLIKEDISNEEIRGMYALRKAQIEQNLQEETLRLKVVETRLKQLERIESDLGEDVMLKSVSPQPFLSYRDTHKNLSDVEAALVELKDTIPKHFGTQVRHLTVVLHGEAFAVEDIDLELGYVLDRAIDKSFELPSGSVLLPSELPPIETAACSVAVGSCENIYLNYGDLGRWVERNDYELLSPHREVMIVLPIPLKREDAVVEIQLPLKVKS